MAAHVINPFLRCVRFGNAALMSCYLFYSSPTRYLGDVCNGAARSYSNKGHDNPRFYCNRVLSNFSISNTYNDASTYLGTNGMGKAIDGFAIIGGCLVCNHFGLAHNTKQRLNNDKKPLLDNALQGLPSWITSDLISETIRAWQPT
jgi:hypothetical protein